MTSLAAQLLVLAKAPMPGLVKTRLSPAFTSEQAAALAEAALVDTLLAVASTEVSRRVLVLEGGAGPWFGPGPFDLLVQRGAGLDERMANGFADTWEGVALPMVLVGMDTPQITPAILTHAVTTLLEPGVDAVLGPAEDGGYWAIGLREPCADVLLGLEMSTDRTGAAQLSRLLGAGLQVRLLTMLRDVDTSEDAAAVSSTAPDSCFAKTWSTLMTDQGRRRTEDAA